MPLGDTDTPRRTMGIALSEAFSGSAGIRRSSHLSKSDSIFARLYYLSSRRSQEVNNLNSFKTKGTFIVSTQIYLPKFSRRSSEKQRLPLSG